MTIGERIRQARKAAKLTQRKLSDRCGYSIQSISDWECGRYDPSERATHALEQALGRTLDKGAE